MNHMFKKLAALCIRLLSAPRSPSGRAMKKFNVGEGLPSEEDVFLYVRMRGFLSSRSLDVREFHDVYYHESFDNACARLGDQPYIAPYEYRGKLDRKPFAPFFIVLHGLEDKTEKDGSLLSLVKIENYEDWRAEQDTFFGSRRLDDPESMRKPVPVARIQQKLKIISTCTVKEFFSNGPDAEKLNRFFNQFGQEIPIWIEQVPSAKKL